MIQEADHIECRLLGQVEMTNEQYHAAPGISKSHLDVIADRSELHYWEAYENPDREPVVPTPALVIGNALHSAILEPDDFEVRYASALDIGRKSNADKAEHARYRQKNYGKVLLAPDDFERCQRIRDRVHAHPVARGLLTGGVAETTYFARDHRHGELIKCRMDYLLPDATIDLKSTVDASEDSFGRDGSKFRYDVQAAWYPYVRECIGIAPTRHFVWVAVEKLPPYAIGIYYATPAQVADAMADALRNYDRIIECRRRNHWPDYGHKVRPLKLTSYSKRNKGRDE